MDNLINLLAVTPSGLWEKLILIFNGGFASFALSIIMLTLCIKVVMLPLDFFNKYISQKNMMQQQQLAPELEKIKKRCKGNKQKEQEETAKLYKQKNINPMGSCLFMLVNLALTLTIFITLLNGLNAMSAFRIQSQYEDLQIAYVQEYALNQGDDIYSIIEENNKKSDDDETKLTIQQIVAPYINEINAISDQTTKTSVLETANKNVSERYEEVKDGFLWIDNIWLSDTPFNSSIPTFDQYSGVARLTDEQKADETAKNTYNQIMDPLRETNGRANGYFVLTVLTAACAFLNQWLMTRKQRKQLQGSSAPAVGSGKFMLVFMPLFMAFFSLMYTSMFSLYLVTSQLVSIATVPLINLIVRKVMEHKKNKNDKINPTNRMRRI